MMVVMTFALRVAREGVCISTGVLMVCQWTRSDLTFTGEIGFGCGLDVHDIDNDQYADLLIGSQGQKNRNGAWLHWGSPRNKFDNSADITFMGEKRSDNFGNYISVGRANDDPYPDIMINAWYYGGAIGRAYLYHGASQRSMDSVPDHTFTGEIPNWESGQIHLVDVNNDGYADVVGGSWTYNNKQGRAILWYGPLYTSVDTTFTWDTTDASIGTHTLKVEIPPVPGEQNTEDNVKTVTIEVKERPK